MKPLLSGELVKLRTTRTFIALVGSALVLSMLVVCLSASLSDHFSDRDLRQLFTANFSSFFILLLGVIGMAGEWRHRTIAGTILAAPDRIRLLAAKLLSYAVAGIVLSAVVTLAIMLAGTLILSARGLPTLDVGSLADLLWRQLLVAGLQGALGVCVGGLVRNQVVAIVGVLVVAFVLEPAILSLLPHVGQFGPTVGAPNGILEMQFDNRDLLEPGYAILVLIGWVGLGFAATGALLRRRDLL
jgi:hypothetical protein